MDKAPRDEVTDERVDDGNWILMFGTQAKCILEAPSEHLARCTAWMTALASDNPKERAEASCWYDRRLTTARWYPAPKAGSSIVTPPRDMDHAGFVVPDGADC